MPAFTMTLQQVLDLNSEADRFKCLGLDTYPIFDVDYRATLNEKIIAHFNEQEIGHETDGMFRFAMRRKMNEIMPLYNQHYTASQIAVDPLKTVSIRNLSTATEASTTDSTTDSTGRVVGSQAPQQRLRPDGDYATSAQDSISQTTAGGTANNTSNGDVTTEGYSGNPAELVFTLRQTFVNVDMMVINELQELFMSVWATSEEFTRGSLYYPSWPYYGLY